MVHTTRGDLAVPALFSSSVFSFSAVPCFAWVVVLLVVTGCAYAPGFYMHASSDAVTYVSYDAQTHMSEDSAAEGADVDDVDVDSRELSSGISDVVGGGRSIADTDDNPPMPMISITPQLIQQMRSGQNSDIPEDVRALFKKPEPYRIGPGDVLHIVTWDYPELAFDIADTSDTIGYNVSPDGFIQFPYVGAIKVAGLTEYEARNLIKENLSRFIRDPQVTVHIRAYRSRRIYLDGEVNRPGLQTLNDIPMTLPEAIARAGGFTSQADQASIALSRQDAVIEINLAQLTERGINPDNILLQPGDMVHIPDREEAKVFVLGEVLNPSTKFLRNGRLTLNEALSDSGGVNPESADPGQIFVIRAAEEPTKPEIFHLDAKSPVAYALAEGFELQPRDVVFVSPVPLVRWNRFISLLLFTSSPVNTTRDALRDRSTN